MEGKKLAYIIEDEQSHAFKIGSAISPQARLRELQVGNPHTLTLVETMPGGQRKERELQETFKVDRLRGEWFIAYYDGDELLVQGKHGLVACFIADGGGWRKKFNVKPGDGTCIVEFKPGW